MLVKIGYGDTDIAVKLFEYMIVLVGQMCQEIFLPATSSRRFMKSMKI